MTTPATQALLPVTPEDFKEAARQLGYPPDITRDDIRYWDGGVKLAEVDQRAIDLARHRQAHSLPGAVGTVRIDNLAARKAVNCVLAPLLAPYISDMPELIEVGNQACTEILAALTPSALSGDAGEGWHLIDSAPKDGTEIQARIPGNGEDNVIAWVDDLIDSNGEYCGAWAFTRDQEPPDCWTDGYCWEVNEDGDRSVQPTHWAALATEAE